MQKFGGGLVAMVIAISHSLLLMTNYCLSLWEKDLRYNTNWQRVNFKVCICPWFYLRRSDCLKACSHQDECLLWLNIFMWIASDWYKHLHAVSVTVILSLWRGVLISFPAHCGKKKTGQPRLVLLVTCPEVLLLYRISTLWYSQAEYFEFQFFHERHLMTESEFVLNFDSACLQFFFWESQTRLLCPSLLVWTGLQN